MRWALLALIGGAAYLFAVTFDLPALRMLCKPLPVLAMLFWILGTPADGYRRWVTVGLVLSMLGDILLEWPINAFVPGLAAFLLAHLAYLAAYLGDTRRLAPLGLLIAGGVGGALFALLYSRGLGPLLLPIALYSLTISAMLWRAIARLGVPSIASASRVFAALGALLFVSSDSMIGINRFVAAFDSSSYAIMLTYWLGQLGIAASVTSRHIALPYSEGQTASRA
ncbi:lysoplasmalogenase [Pseudomonas nitroreducens]|uniref:lysoplasmalogenase n=1 Tax=Pseudomonas nitroreducens TaxID=46680 RepID=UPI0023F81CE2|nr:lysoplasmalogenase [Pseudomonas nitroreducens]WEX00507.1 lysoplasmalogenase [Pseudomonas nitroreducens]